MEYDKDKEKKDEEKSHSDLFMQVPKDVKKHMVTFFGKRTLKQVQRVNKEFQDLIKGDRPRSVADIAEPRELKKSLFESREWQELPKEVSEKASKLFGAEIVSIKTSDDGIIAFSLPFDAKKLSKFRSVKPIQELEKKETTNLNKLLDSKYKNMVPGFFGEEVDERVLYVITNDSQILIDLGLEPDEESRPAFKK